MATFGLSVASGEGDKTGALNYALNNIGQGLQVDIFTGKISAPNTDPRVVYTLAFRYATITFADDQYGNGQDLYPDGKNYYGIWSFNIPVGGSSLLSPPLTPQQYTWFPLPTQPAPAGSALFYQALAPYIIGDVYLDTAGSTPTPGFKEFFSGLTSYQIDTFEYIAPNIAAINLTALSSAPIFYQVGTIAVANGTGWDPGGLGTPHPVFYDGTSWISMI